MTERFLNSRTTCFRSAVLTSGRTRPCWLRSLLVAQRRAGHHLNTAQANVEYHFGTKFSGTAGLFDITGTRDPLLFAPAAVAGSANGSPQSNGYTLNVSWWPEQNVDLAVQYTGYFRFNGAQTNYDGAGRDAAANNTVYVLARFVF